VTTIGLEGTAADARPVVGATLELDEDDQYGIVVGGADGTVLREEFIGSGGVIVEISAVVEDKDGNWAMAVTVQIDDPDGGSPRGRERTCRWGRRRRRRHGCSCDPGARRGCASLGCPRPGCLDAHHTDRGAARRGRPITWARKS
jgi:hypothetical protein